MSSTTIGPVVLSINPCRHVVPPWIARRACCCDARYIESTMSLDFGVYRYRHKQRHMGTQVSCQKLANWQYCDQESSLPPFDLSQPGKYVPAKAATVWIKVLTIWPADMHCAGKSVKTSVHIQAVLLHATCARSTLQCVVGGVILMFAFALAR